MWQHLPQSPDNITDPLETLPVYTNVFGKIGLVTLGVAVVMLLMVLVAETHDCDAGKPLIILAESRVALSLPCFTLHGRTCIDIKAMPFSHNRVWRGDIR